VWFKEPVGFLRAKEGTNIAHIVDFDDRMSFILMNQSRTRRRLYKERYDGAVGLKFLEYRTAQQVIEAISKYD